MRLIEAFHAAEPTVTLVFNLYESFDEVNRAEAVVALFSLRHCHVNDAPLVSRIQITRIHGFHTDTA